MDAEYYELIGEEFRKLESKFQTTIAGKELIVEFGKYALQASGSVLVRYGDTVVLATAVVSDEPKDADFFPLTVNYEERLYAAGKIPGGFIKREGRPSEKAILASRLIDRPVRPLFPDNFRHDIQVIATVMSVDQDCSSELAAMLGVSLALSVSKAPFGGPVAGVAVGRIDGEFVLNPTSVQLETSDLNIVLAGSAAGINMVEAEGDQVDEADVLEAILFGYEGIKELLKFQEEVLQQLPTANKLKTSNVADKPFQKSAEQYALNRLGAAFEIVDKQERAQFIESTKRDTVRFLIDEEKSASENDEEHIRRLVSDLFADQVRKRIVDEGKRPDGRGLTDIRPLSSEIGLLPRAHGSGLFRRGQTQVLSVCTLGPLGDVQVLDGLGSEESKRYIHHYNFPSYSVGENRPIRGPGRREIGHGALGERALLAVIPSVDSFPYTVRVVSEVLESNGSSSQASICATTLSLMDAGVPILAPVAGIAMGLIKEENKVAVLTDIQGLEDHVGDMDFKVAGTRKGVTALQMDIKIDGIDREILAQSLEQAKAARLQLLDSMELCIAEPKSGLSRHAPKILAIQVNPDKIRTIIGPGGRVINQIIEEHDVKIDIEQDGRVYISSTDQEKNEKAKNTIEALVREVTIGEIYSGTVKRIEKYGAFVELFPGKESLVHISQLDSRHIEKVEDAVKLGDTIMVKVTEIDDQGRVKASRKAALVNSTDKGSSSNKDKRKKN